MRILYPPHPCVKIHSTELPSFESTGRWVAQYKLNGTRNLIHILPNGQIELFNRHGIHHRQFQLTATLENEIRSLRIQPGLEYWLDGELLNAKTTTPAYKGRIVLFDVLFSGRYLFGIDQLTRLDLLRKICGNPEVPEPNLGLALQATQNIWMLQSWDSDFAQHYERFIDQPEVEGLVLRQKKSQLDNLGTKMYDVTWIIRCRKPTRNYTL
jgi:ATP-dependent DNA ligase